MSQQSETRKEAQKAIRTHTNQKKFVSELAGTNEFTTRKEARDIYREEKLRYRNDNRISKTSKIDYNNLNQSRTPIVSKYSFKVLVGYEYNDTTETYNHDIEGNRRPVYVTVRTNKHLHQNTIVKQAEKSYSKSQQEYITVNGKKVRGSGGPGTIHHEENEQRITGGLRRG